MKYYIQFKRGSGNHKYKLMVYDNKTDKLLKTVNFGALKKPKNGFYKHYRDSTGLGLYSHLDYKNNDPNAEKYRKAYRARHSKIKTKDGRLAYKIPFTASWASWHFLWD